MLYTLDIYNWNPSKWAGVRFARDGRCKAGFDGPATTSILCDVGSSCGADRRIF